MSSRKKQEGWTFALWLLAAVQLHVGTPYHVPGAQFACCEVGNSQDKHCCCVMPRDSTRLNTILYETGRKTAWMLSAAAVPAALPLLLMPAAHPPPHSLAREPPVGRVHLGALLQSCQGGLGGSLEPSLPICQRKHVPLAPGPYLLAAAGDLLQHGVPVSKFWTL